MSRRRIIITPEEFFGMNGHGCGVVDVAGAYFGVSPDGAWCFLPELQMSPNALTNMIMSVPKDWPRTKVVAYNYTDLNWFNNLPSYLMNRIGDVINFVFLEPLLFSFYEHEHEIDVTVGVLSGRPMTMTTPTRNEEIETLRAWEKKTGKTVVVVTCEDNVAEAAYCDMFLFTAAHITNGYMSSMRGARFDADVESFENLRWKIGTFNWRPRSHRALLAAAALGLDETEEDARVTWYARDTVVAPHVTSAPHAAVIARGAERLHALLKTRPYALAGHEIGNFAPLLGLGDEWDEPEVDTSCALSPFSLKHAVIGEYPKCASVLVGETNFFNHRPNFSEKTFFAMACKRPVLLAAPPGTLRLLRDLGFATWPEMFDESYDDVLDHERRLCAIIDNMRRVMSMSRDELRTILRSMKDGLDHNAEHISKIDQPLRKLFETVTR